MNTQIEISPKRERLMALTATQTVINGLKSDKSKIVYTREIERFDDWLGARSLTRQSVMAYVAYCEERRLSAATVNARLAAIRAVVREAEISGGIPYALARPILAIKNRPTSRVKTAVWLEHSQVTEILGACDGSPKSVRDRALFAIAVSTGLRRSELAGLQWSQLKKRRKNDTLVSVKVKGGKVRDITIQKSAMRFVNRWAKLGGKAGAMFKQTKRGEIVDESTLSDRSVSYAIESLCDTVGVKVAAHDLRRTYANMLDEADVPIRKIQFLLGHASVKTTEAYLKPMREAKTARNDYFTF